MVVSTVHCKIRSVFPAMLSGGAATPALRIDTLNKQPEASNSPPALVKVNSDIRLGVLIGDKKRHDTRILQTDV